MIRWANLLFVTPTSRQTNLQYDLRWQFTTRTPEFRQTNFQYDQIRGGNLLLETPDSGFDI